MVQRIQCLYCGRGLHGEWCYFILEASSFCGTCNHSHKREECLYFCNTGCLCDCIEENRDLIKELSDRFKTNTHHSWDGFDFEGRLQRNKVGAVLDSVSEEESSEYKRTGVKEES